MFKWLGLPTNSPWSSWVVSGSMHGVPGYGSWSWHCICTLTMGLSKSFHTNAHCRPDVYTTMCCIIHEPFGKQLTNVLWGIDCHMYLLGQLFVETNLRWFFKNSDAIEPVWPCMHVYTTVATHVIHAVPIKIAWNQKKLTGFDPMHYPWCRWIGIRLWCRVPGIKSCMWQHISIHIGFDQVFCDDTFDTWNVL